MEIHVRVVDGYVSIGPWSIVYGVDAYICVPPDRCFQYGDRQAAASMIIEGSASQQESSDECQFWQGRPIVYTI